MNQLDTVRYTSSDAAARLNLSEPEFRVYARKAGKTAPFSEQDINEITTAITAEDTPEATTIDVAENITTPITGLLSPALTAFADALEAEAIALLSAEMRRRAPAIRAAVVDAIFEG